MPSSSSSVYTQNAPKRARIEEPIRFGFEDSEYESQSDLSFNAQKSQGLFSLQHIIALFYFLECFSAINLKEVFYQMLRFKICIFFYICIFKFSSLWFSSLKL